MRFGWSQWVDIISGIILGGVAFLVDWKHLGFCWIWVKTRTDDGVQASWQGPLFSEITRPFSKKMFFLCLGVNKKPNPGASLGAGPIINPKTSKRRLF